MIRGSSQVSIGCSLLVQAYKCDAVVVKGLVDNLKDVIDKPTEFGLTHVRNGSRYSAAVRASSSASCNGVVVESRNGFSPTKKRYANCAQIVRF